MEAPRGTLVHHYVTDEKGIVRKVNLIVGTTNNYAAMSLSVKKAAQALIDGKTEISEGVLNRIEMAFRAYDPCMACATHSLPGHMPLDVTLRDPPGPDPRPSNPDVDPPNPVTGRVAVPDGMAVPLGSFCPQCFGGVDSRGASRRDVAGDLGDSDQQEGDADQDGNTAGLDAGKGRRHEPGRAEGAEQAEGGADQRELRSGGEHEAGDVSGPGSQRDADPEFAGALGHGAGDHAVDAQRRQTEPEQRPSPRASCRRTP